MAASMRQRLLHFAAAARVDFGAVADERMSASVHTS